MYTYIYLKCARVCRNKLYRTIGAVVVHYSVYSVVTCALRCVCAKYLLL